MEIFDLNKLKDLVKSGKTNEISSYMKLHNLVVEGNKIIPKDPEEYKKKSDFWDKRQYVRKILLNSLNLGTYISNAV